MRLSALSRETRPERRDFGRTRYPLRALAREWFWRLPCWLFSHEWETVVRRTRLQLCLRCGRVRRRP